MNKIFLLFTCVMSPTFLNAGEGIDFELNQNEFYTSEQFEVKLTTDSEKPITYLGLSIEKKENENWVNVRYYTNCECNKECKKRATFINSKLTKYEQWDFKNQDCKVAPPGVYRAVLRSEHNVNIAKEFKIK